MRKYDVAAAAYDEGKTLGQSRLQTDSEKVFERSNLVVADTQTAEAEGAQGCIGELSLIKSKTSDVRIESKIALYAEDRSEWLQDITRVENFADTVSVARRKLSREKIFYAAVNCKFPVFEIFFEQ